MNETVETVRDKDDLGAFHLNKKLCQGGMGSLLEVELTEGHPLKKRVLGSILAWSEVTSAKIRNMDHFKSIKQKIERGSKKLSRLRESRDNYEGTLFDTKNSEINGEEKKLTQLEDELREFQYKWVQNRTCELEKSELRYIHDEIITHGRTIPADGVYAMKRSLSQEPRLLRRFKHEFIQTNTINGLKEGRELFVEAYALLLNSRNNTMDSYIMELLRKAIPLDHYVTGKAKCSLDEKLEMLCTVCDGLTVLHKEGIIHRDIKPQNIVQSVSAKRKVKIIDLGIAKDLAGASTTMENGAIGTPLYMHPLQTMQSKFAEPCFDIHALVATAHHIMLGKAPYDLFVDSDTKTIHECKSQIPNYRMELIRNRQYEMVEPALLFDVPELLSKVLMKGLHDGYKTAEDLKQAFQMCREELKPIYLRRKHLNPKEVPDSVKQSKKGGLKKYIAISAAVATLAAGGIAYTLFGNSKPVAKVEEVQPRLTEQVQQQGGLEEKVVPTMKGCVLDIDFNDVYEKDGQTYVRDKSGNGNNGRVYGATVIKDSEGTYMSFDGIDDYIEFDLSPTLNPEEPTPRSISARIRLNNTKRRQSIVSTFGEENGSELRVDNGEIINIIYVNNKQKFSTYLLSQKDQNEWLFIGCTLDQLQNRFYINGKLIKRSSVNSPNLNRNNKLILGRAALYENLFLEGQIERLQIFNKSLDQTKMTEISLYK